MGAGAGIRFPKKGRVAPIQEWMQTAERLSDAYFEEKNDRKSWANIADEYREQLEELCSFISNAELMWDTSEQQIVGISQKAAYCLKTATDHRASFWDEHE